MRSLRPGPGSAVRRWGFLRADHRQEVRWRMALEKPYLVVGSPPCTDFSIMFRNLCAGKMDPEVVRQRRVKADVSLRFAAEVYQMHHGLGTHFLHEHPAGADSWQTPRIQRLRRDPRVTEVTAHQCMLGQTTTAPDGRVLPVLKVTRFLSSAPAVLAELELRCSRDHEHQPLVGGRAAAAAVYPPRAVQSDLFGDRQAADPRRAGSPRTGPQSPEPRCWSI